MFSNVLWLCQTQLLPVNLRSLCHHPVHLYLFSMCFFVTFFLYLLQRLFSSPLAPNIPRAWLFRRREKKTNCNRSCCPLLLAFARQDILFASNCPPPPTSARVRQMTGSFVLTVKLCNPHKYKFIFDQPFDNALVLTLRCKISIT